MRICIWLQMRTLFGSCVDDLLHEASGVALECRLELQAVKLIFRDVSCVIRSLFDMLTIRHACPQTR